MRIQKKLQKVMDKYHSPSPLLRFDLAPEELLMLRDKKVLAIDDGQLKTIQGRKMTSYIRDIAHHSSEEEDDDNLLGRPKCKPTPAGPVFR